MTGQRNLSYKDLEDLTSLMRKRSQRVLEKFGEVSVSGITDPTFLKLLQYVKGYWTDNFRPALTSFCCEVVGGNVAAADDASLMITLASAGGGIHDDILDKSLNKHFRMTVLGLYGPDLALIAGDLLIIKGWAMAVELIKKTYPEKLARIIEIFGDWTLDVCEAEFMEVSCRKNLDTKLGCYERILRKSIADSEACAKLGAVMGNGSEEEIQALAEFGGRLGFMYRLAGEAKDLINVEANLAIRLQNESVPLPLLYAAKSSKESYNEIEAILNNSDITIVDLMKLQKLCFESGGFAYLLNKSKKNLRQAQKRVRIIKPSSARDKLESMIQKSYSDILDMFR
jgi:geranylgeranyl diphosphate synthase, type I